MKMRVLMVVALFSLAGKAASGQGGTLEKVHSRLLDRTVEVALHVPSETSLAKWKATHPGWHPRLVLFLTGAYDGPDDLIKRGVFQHLAAQEEAGLLPPSLWASPEHYQILVRKPQGWLLPLRALPHGRTDPGLGAGTSRLRRH